jgi:transposase-like protein
MVVFSLTHDLMSLEQFLEHFNTEEACADFLFQVKWPDGFSCPRCAHRRAYTTSTRRLPLYECASCRHQTSLIAGTVMEGSRTELRKWLLALFLIAHPDKGITSLKLSRTIKVTYKTAWLMLHKIRHAMGEADTSTLLSGFARVNIACYGQPYNPTVFRHPQQQPLFIGASMNEQGEPVYVKIKVIPDSHMKDWNVLREGPEEFEKRHVKPGTPVEIIAQRYKSNRFKQLLLLFREADKWINDTFHGLGPRHLQAYLNEFCYRLNLKLRKAHIFERLARLCAGSRAITYTALTKAERAA